jgi:hypothetical protein
MADKEIIALSTKMIDETSWASSSGKFGLKCFLIHKLN